MRVQVLGCSAGIGAGLRTTSLLIDDDVLVDCGTGAGDLDMAGLRAVRHVFLTHAHLDHIALLPLLIDTVFEQLQKQPLTIHCQASTYEVLRRHIFNWHVWPDFFELPDKRAPAVRFEPLAPGESHVLGARGFEMIEVTHSVPAAAYRIHSANGVLAFSGDTTSNNWLWSVLNRHQRLDLLIVECAFPEADAALSLAAGHYCPSLLAADLAKLEHRPRIYVTHLKPGAEAVTLRELRAMLPQFDLHRLLTGQVFEL
ncbi:MAG: 3',5'-cyclic-nucleotide phosphodiesterase [Gammaproteobacteria bacterium]|nr:3',5'-cyclic-nucleotide phosphodiesterase [Gammaproteobacteria bacterium]